MKWFVFVDVEYYPYVGDPVEADTAEEALRLASEGLGPGDGVYVAPASAVTGGTVHGPERKPQGLLALQAESNRRRDAQRDLLAAGGFSAVVEPGSAERAGPWWVG